MGYVGLKTVIDAMQVKEVPKRIDTGVKLVTKDILEDPEVKELLRYQ